MAGKTPSSVASEHQLRPKPHCIPEFNDRLWEKVPRFLTFLKCRPLRVPEETFPSIHPAHPCPILTVRLQKKRNEGYDLVYCEPLADAVDVVKVVARQQVDVLPLLELHAAHSTPAVANIKYLQLP